MKSEMKRWEYWKFDYVPTTEEMDHFGEDGWELVCVTVVQGETVVIFKQEVLK